MKVSDVIKISYPEFMPVRVTQKCRSIHCSQGHGECDDYERCDDYECECEEFQNNECIYGSYEISYTDFFDGSCDDVPIKLADKKVVGISVSERITRHRRTSHDKVQLVIEIAHDKDW